MPLYEIIDCCHDVFLSSWTEVQELLLRQHLIQFLSQNLRHNLISPFIQMAVPKEYRFSLPLNLFFDCSRGVDNQYTVLLTEIKERLI